MTETAPGTRSPLSWQQAGRLRRDVVRDERTANCTTTFPLPADVTTDDLRAALASLADRSDVLHVTGVSLDDGGYAVHADDVDVRLRTESVASAHELAAVVEAMANHRFPRDGGLLWDVAVVEHADPVGRPARTVCAALDHLIGDRRTSYLVRLGLLRPDALDDARRAPYREWVGVQRTEYPADPAVETPARAFWRRYLDGVAPDRGPLLPFCLDPDGPLSGTVHVTFRDLPTSTAILRDAGARRQATPFLLLLGAVASALSAASEIDDLVLVVNTTGRTTRYLDTLGWFASAIPIRVRGAGLADPARALAAARTGWLAALRHQASPWDYVLAVTTPDFDPVSNRPPRVDLNFMPHANVDPPPAKLADGSHRELTLPGELGGLKLMVTEGTGGRWQVVCQFDRQRFDAAGVHGFLDDLSARLAMLTSES